MAWLPRRRRKSVPAAAAAPLDPALDDLKILVGLGLARQQKECPPPRRLSEVEFKVFSQFGDDGILQHLIASSGAAPDVFVEFGVSDYLESNTRFLLQGCNWRGLVLDSGEAEIRSIRARDFYWRHDLTAVQAFIDRDNIDALLTGNGFAGPLGLLSIDIDGNDYWVWEAIRAVDPVIVVVEYNGVYGPERAVAVPYDARFSRTAAHPSNLYWGASLGAFCVLAERKGYACVGSNSAGNNAYFVRRDRLGALRPLRSAEAWVESRFRDSRDEAGQLSFLSGSARRRPIADLPLLDVEHGNTLSVADLDR
jgi:hypothetical protein